MFKDEILPDGSKISEMELNSQIEYNSEKKSIAENNLDNEDSEIANNKSGKSTLKKLVNN